MMTNPTRSARAAIAVLALGAACGGVEAQEYPARAIRLLVPFPAGGGSDTIARVTAQKLSAQLGQQVVVDNRAGASGNIAAEIAAKAAPDGYTLMFANSSIAITPAVYTKLSFDPVKDFMPISMVSSYPFMLVVHPAVPVKSVKELVALAKEKPGGLTFSSAGAGTMSHLAMELFALRTGTKLTHLPYKGAAPAAIGLMSGEAQVAFIVMPVAQVQVNAGKLRGIAVAAKNRSAVLPQVPTLQEAGVADNEALQWNGLFAPAKTPQPILDRLYRELTTVLAAPDLKQRFEAEGADPAGNTPKEFAAFFRAEAAKWADVTKRSGTRLD